MDKLLVTRKEAGRLLSISRNTITKLLNEKHLSTVLLPGSKRELIDVEELKKLINERKVYAN